MVINFTSPEEIRSKATTTVRLVDEDLKMLQVSTDASGSGIVIRHVDEDEFGDEVVTDVYFDTFDIQFLISVLKDKRLL